MKFTEAGHRTALGFYLGHHILITGNMEWGGGPIPLHLNPSIPPAATPDSQDTGTPVQGAREGAEVVAGPGHPLSGMTSS